MGNVIFGADSRLDQDTLTASVAADANFPLVNTHDDRAFTLYKMGSAATEAFIKTDAGVGNTPAVNYFMLIGHDLSDPDKDGNGGILLQFQRSPDDIVYTTIFSQTIATNRILVRSFSQTLDRFFRIRLTRASSFKASLGEIQWGNAFGVADKLVATVGFDPNDETIEGQFNRSRSGQLMGAVRAFSMRRARVRLEMVTDAFVRGTFLAFWDTHASLLKPFLFWWNEGSPGAFERDAFFAIVDPGGGINRPLRTQLDVGFRDIEFTVIGLKE